MAALMSPTPTVLEAPTASTGRLVVTLSAERDGTLVVLGRFIARDNSV